MVIHLLQIELQLQQQVFQLQSEPVVLKIQEVLQLVIQEQIQFFQQ